MCHISANYGRNRLIGRALNAGAHTTPQSVPALPVRTSPTLAIPSLREQIGVAPLHPLFESTRHSTQRVPSHTFPNNRCRSNMHRRMVTLMSCTVRTVEHPICLSGSQTSHRLETHTPVGCSQSSLVEQHEPRPESLGVSSTLTIAVIIDAIAGVASLDRPSRPPIVYTAQLTICQVS